MNQIQPPLSPLIHFMTSYDFVSQVWRIRFRRWFWFECLFRRRWYLTLIVYDCLLRSVSQSALDSCASGNITLRTTYNLTALDWWICHLICLIISKLSYSEAQIHPIHAKRAAAFRLRIHLSRFCCSWSGRFSERALASRHRQNHLKSHALLKGEREIHTLHWWWWS